jgi:hypothetical protein
MANNLTKNVVANILRKFLKPWQNDIVTLNTVNKSIIPKGSVNPRSGSTVQVKRPHQWKTERTSDGDISTGTRSDIIAATATATVQNYFTEHVEWGQLEEAIQLDQLQEILDPIRQKIITDIEVDFNKFIKNNGAHFLGTVDTAVDSWGDVAQVNSFCKAIGMSGDIYAQLGPYAIQDLADAQKGIFSESLAKSAWEQSIIPRNFGGVQAYVSNSLPTHTVGDHDGGLQLNAAPTQTYLGAKDTYQTTMVLKGADTSVTGFLKQGDIIEVAGKYLNQMQTKEQATGRAGAGITYKGVVNADVDSTAGGLVTVVVNGPAISDGVNYDTISAALATDDVVNVLSGTASGTTVPNLFYHRDAFGFLTVDLPKLHAIDSQVANFMGMSIRIHKYADGDANKQICRFDVLPAYAPYNPLQAGRFYGN